MRERVDERHEQAGLAPEVVVDRRDVDVRGVGDGLQGQAAHTALQEEVTGGGQDGLRGEGESVERPPVGKALADRPALDLARPAAAASAPASAPAPPALHASSTRP